MSKFDKATHKLLEMLNNLKTGDLFEFVHDISYFDLLEEDNTYSSFIVSGNNKYKPNGLLPKNAVAMFLEYDLYYDKVGHGDMCRIKYLYNDQVKYTLVQIYEYNKDTSYITLLK